MTNSVHSRVNRRKGGRPATGTLEWREASPAANGQPAKPAGWWARVTFLDKARPWVDLDPSIPFDDEAAARECAQRVSDEVRSAGAVVARETVREYATRWNDWREERGLKCVKDDRPRLENHVFTFRRFGDLDMHRVKRADLEDLVEELDLRVRAGELGAKVAILAWGNVSGIFRDACSAKRRDLRVRADNPAASVRAPDPGVKKSKQYLYPSEVAALLACGHVPLRWRRLFAVAVYSYARAGELEGIMLPAVDCEHGVLHLHQSVDRVRDRGNVEETKNGLARRVPLEPEVLPLFTFLRAQAEATIPADATPAQRAEVSLLAMPSPGMLSEKLRFYLKKAGVTRTELFTTTRTHKRITFHDLRATGITWCAIRGDNPLTLMQRAGHQHFTTTQGYIRDAENLRAGSFGDVFPPLPPELAGNERPGFVLGFVQDRPVTPPELNHSRGLPGWAQQDLNLPTFFTNRHELKRIVTSCAAF